jgi:hypothetical protein
MSCAGLSFFFDNYDLINNISYCMFMSYINYIIYLLTKKYMYNIVCLHKNVIATGKS